jgi:hypothetical protein
MPATSLSKRTRDSRTAESLLGVGHPLVAVLGACQAATEALAAGAALQVAALGVWAAGVSFGRPLAIGAALMQLVAGIRWAYLRLERRDLCRELIAEGHDRLPLQPLAREGRRLLDPAYRDRLARSLEVLADMPSGRPSLCSRRVVAAVKPQLREAAALMRESGANVRGVALVDRLLTCGDSPLYGEDAALLRDELARARYMLV